MDRQELKEALRAFPYDRKDYWILGGGAMVLHGIKTETADIDLGCCAALANQLEQDGYLLRRTADGKRWFRWGSSIELFEDWIRGPVTLTDGFQLVAPEGLLAMKRELGREKDRLDAERIEAFLRRAPDARDPGTGRIGKKIVVTGCCGSGKSTLARKLFDRTGLPLTHLDMIWWRPDATHIRREEFDQRLETILRGERWIVEGDYSRTYEMRLRACDTMIFLDYDEETCMAGIRQRVGQKRSDIPWVEQRLEPELVEFIYSYRQIGRPKLYQLFEQYPEKQIILFKNRAEADAWLETVSV